eukprot:GHVS01004513.1.p1 GENE.GHVS01004513.1~~GHVS01004513.1.p1  ORF type:complete len:957 (+),score=112.38 GHVS01004513.1:592-3462(+)
MVSWRQVLYHSTPQTLFLLLLLPLLLHIVSAQVGFEGTNDDHEISERRQQPLDPKEDVELLNDKDEDNNNNSILGISLESTATDSSLKQEEEDGIHGIGHLVVADSSITPTTTTNTESSSSSLRASHNGNGGNGNVCSSSECKRVADIIISHTNMTADPCNDIDNYVCGGWRDGFELPIDETGWTISFDEIANKTRHTIKSILEEHSCEMLLQQSDNSRIKKSINHSTTTSTTTTTTTKTSTGGGTVGGDGSSSEGIVASSEHKKQSASSFDRWDALSTCLYESCMDTEEIDKHGATPMMRLLFENDNNNDSSTTTSDSSSSSLSWLVDGKFDIENKETINNKKNIFNNRMYSLTSKLQDIYYWGFWVGLNTLDPTKHQTFRIHGSGLGLSYHFYDDKHTDIQIQYKRHLANLLELFDVDLEKYDKELMKKYKINNPNRREQTFEKRAERIYNFELSLRRILLSPEESRNVVKYTKAITYDNLKNKSSFIDIGIIIDYYLKQSNKLMSGDHEILIHEIDYFEKLSVKLKQTEHWDVIFDHILVHTISGYASMLSQPWRNEKEDYNRKRTGAETLPRWRTCRLSPPSWIISRRYINEKYDTRRKELTNNLVTDLKKAFKNMLTNYSWMSEETKKLAKNKLKNMTEKIAYPKWLEENYDEYFIKYYGDSEDTINKIINKQNNSAAAAGSYFTSKLHLGRMGTLYELSQLKEPQDMTEWHMNPQSVNAYYSPSMNQIAFMAAILEEPSVFVWNNELGGRAEELVMRALTYGGIGGIIGHEITHGFDDKGKDYDQNGRLHKWWTDKSEINFMENAKCVEEQYNNYSVKLPIKNENDGTIDNVTFNVRGALTLGENIADNGGVQLAWEALKLTLTETELNSQPLIQFGVSLTTTQLFMFAWGHFWCSVNRPKSVRRRIETDPHSPDEFRTEGPLANFELFAKVFECPKGSTMNREDVCRVW